MVVYNYVVGICWVSGQTGRSLVRGGSARCQGIFQSLSGIFWPKRCAGSQLEKRASLMRRFANHLPTFGYPDFHPSCFSIDCPPFLPVRTTIATCNIRHVYRTGHSISFSPNSKFTGASQLDICFVRITERAFGRCAVTTT